MRLAVSLFSPRTQGSCPLSSWSYFDGEQRHFGRIMIRLQQLIKRRVGMINNPFPPDSSDYNLSLPLPGPRC